LSEPAVRCASCSRRPAPAAHRLPDGAGGEPDLDIVARRRRRRGGRPRRRCCPVVSWTSACPHGRRRRDADIVEAKLRSGAHPDHVRLDEYVVGALRAGASGFLAKDVRPTDLVTAIRTSRPARRSWRRGSQRCSTGSPSRCPTVGPRRRGTCGCSRRDGRCSFQLAGGCPTRRCKDCRSARRP